MTDTKVLMTRVTVLHNVTADHSGRPLGMLDGYQHGHILVPVAQYEENTTMWDFATVAETLCNDAYRVFNGVDMRTTDEELRSVAYRARKNRSLSVGDVVAITAYQDPHMVGGVGAHTTRYYAVASVGWEQLDRPARFVAFVSQHGTTGLDRDDIQTF